MHELVLRLPESLVEAVSEALVDELDALSVSVADADAGTAAEQALFGEPGMPAPKEGWQRSDLTALFETEAAATEAATLLRAQDWATSMTVLALRAVEDQDWERAWLDQFEPMRFGNRTWIIPWHRDAPPEAAPPAEPAVLRAATRPPRPTTSERTTSMPMPRPERPVTSVAVLKPGAKISCAAASSSSASAVETVLASPSL